MCVCVSVRTTGINALPLLYRSKLLGEEKKFQERNKIQLELTLIASSSLSLLLARGDLMQSR